MPSPLLCTLDSLDDPGSRGFCVQLQGETVEIFLVRRADQVYAYRNRCPHAGSPLDWQVDEYLDDDKTHILCATHGALFRIEDGHCVAGPCRSQSLSPVALNIQAGAVRLAD